MSFILFNYYKIIQESFLKSNSLKRCLKPCLLESFISVRPKIVCTSPVTSNSLKRTGFIELILTPNRVTNSVFFKFSVLQKDECKQTGIKITRSFRFYNLTGICFYLTSCIISWRHTWRRGVSSCLSYLNMQKVSYYHNGSDNVEEIR